MRNCPCKLSNISVGKFRRGKALVATDASVQRAPLMMQSHAAILCAHANAQANTQANTQTNAQANAQVYAKVNAKVNAQNNPQINTQSNACMSQCMIPCMSSCISKYMMCHYHNTHNNMKALLVSSAVSGAQYYQFNDKRTHETMWGEMKRNSAVVV